MARKRCYSCRKVREVFSSEEGREIDGTRFSIPLCYECYRENKDRYR